jgi:hypothetical protein
VGTEVDPSNHALQMIPVAMFLAGLVPIVTEPFLDRRSPHRR